MTLLELHKVLGDRINVTLNENLSAEEKIGENEQTKIIIGVARQMINNSKIILEYEKATTITNKSEESIMRDIIGK